MERVDRDDVDVGGEVLLERSSFRRLDRGLARHNRADLCSCPTKKGSAPRRRGEQGGKRTRSEERDDLVEVLGLDRVDDKVALARDEVSIPHRRKPSPCGSRPISSHPTSPRARAAPPLQSSTSLSYFSGKSHTFILCQRSRISSCCLQPSPPSLLQDSNTRRETDVPLPPSLAQSIRVHLPHLSHPNDPNPDRVLLVLHGVQAADESTKTGGGGMEGWEGGPSAGSARSRGG